MKAGIAYYPGEGIKIQMKRRDIFGLTFYVSIFLTLWEKHHEANGERYLLHPYVNSENFP